MAFFSRSSQPVPQVDSLPPDAALARRLSLAARRRAEEFDWPRSAAHLLEVYCTLLPVPVCA